MYGFIHCCLQDMVLKQFGKETWEKIIEESGVKVEGEYVIHAVYTDEETMKLISAAVKLSGIPLNGILEAFGDHFYNYCKASGYTRILRILGRTLREFLCNLDALHDHLAGIYPGMDAPSFRTTERADGGMDLHYYSSRKGLDPVVIGVIKAVARDCLHTQVEIKIDRVGEGGHIVFAIYENNNKNPTPGTTSSSSVDNPNAPPSSDVSQQPARRNSITNSIMTLFKRKRQLMSVNSFSEAFPFHVVFDRSLNIRQCGSSISKYIDTQGYSNKKNKEVIYSSFTDTFRLMRPKMNFTFETVMNHINTVFVVTSKRQVELPKKREASSNVQAGPMGEIAQELKLKGQMIYLPLTDCIMFLCTPRVRKLEELGQRGIYLSDIPLHDATRELILATKEHAEDRKLMTQVEDSNNGLKILQQKLVYNKQITDELLHELIPPNVARQLRLNLPVSAESYEVVTILFSDLVGFTALCSHEAVVPMDIIKLLNSLYTIFDSISSMYEIYKVETIGDAYMGVCGIPTYVKDHAERVARMGMDMLACIKNVQSPVESHPVRIRIGLHSGSCRAGVVGKKTPRYCLFGRTVTIANKMESGSSAGKLNVSFETRKYLDAANWVFKENTNENPIECFFLEKSESYKDYPGAIEKDLTNSNNIAKGANDLSSASSTSDNLESLTLSMTNKNSIASRRGHNNSGLLSCPFSA